MAGQIAVESSRHGRIPCSVVAIFMPMGATGIATSAESPPGTNAAFWRELHSQHHEEKGIAREKEGVGTKKNLLALLGS